MTCSYLCLVIFATMVSTVFPAPWRDTIILGDDTEVIRLEVDTRQIPKRSVQPKSENIVFPEDDYASSTTARTQRPTAASFALPGVNSSTPGPNSISRYPVASVSSKLPGVKPVGLAFPESTSSSSEEREDDAGNVVIGTQVSKFISWVKEKGLPDNYTEPSTNIDDIPIDNFNLGRVQALKCPPGQVSHRGRCMNRAEI